MTTPSREVIVGQDGRVVLTFVRTTRDGLNAADLVQPAPDVALELVASVAQDAFPGWAVSAPPELGRLLLQRGATTIRHAHRLSRDLVSDPPDPAWAVLEPGPGLVVAPATLVAEDYLDAAEAAYPAGHPDHEPVASTEERIAKDITPLLDGTYGQFLTESAVVRTVDPRGVVGPVVAACVLVVRAGSAPWVVEVFRRPEPAYAGLGTLLLKRCMADLVTSGFGHLELAVTDANLAARRSYERLGFSLVLESLTVRLPAAD